MYLSIWSEIWGTVYTVSFLGVNGNEYSLKYETDCGNNGLDFEFIQDTGGVGSGRNLQTNNFTEKGKTWYHVAGTYDGTTQKIYVNGVLINSASYSGTMLALSGKTVAIGVRANKHEGFWTGLIDELKIYNYARSQKQIVEDMNGGASGGRKPGWIPGCQVFF